MKMQIKKHLKPKKIILTLCIVWIIYLIGIPLYYTPYALQPSYWEFKKLCEINNLPDGEEKYNKILTYYNMNLDDIDWKKINENKQFLCKKIRKDWRFDYVDDYEFSDCLPNVREYRARVIQRQMNYRLTASVWIYNNKSTLNRDNITDMEVTTSWDTRRFELIGDEGSGFYWYEKSLSCSHIEKSHLKNKGSK